MQRSMFKLLSTEEKSTLWKSKFEIYLQNSELSEVQKVFVEKLIGVIRPELYNNLNPSYPNNVNEKLLRETALKLFGVKESYNLLGTISNPNVAAPAPGNCSCSKSSDWCHEALYCSTWLCNETSGCGTFLAYTCNGKCW